MSEGDNGAGKVLDGFIDVDTLLRELGICRRTLLRWESLGIAPPFARLGARRIYDVLEVRRWIATQRELPIVTDARRARFSRASRRAAVARLGRQYKAEAKAEAGA